MTPWPSITKISLEITYLKSYSNRPGANESIIVFPAQDISGGFVGRCVQGYTLVFPPNSILWDVSTYPYHLGHTPLKSFNG